jgi:hypothetical protein
MSKTAQSTTLPLRSRKILVLWFGMEGCQCIQGLGYVALFFIGFKVLFVLTKLLKSFTEPAPKKVSFRFLSLISNLITLSPLFHLKKDHNPTREGRK